tara:strand:- start:1982 stop:2227 length:246 start_codon:yes stop_codon:yes gene_type:complete
MGCDTEHCRKKPTNEKKWKWTLMTTIIFLIVVNPSVYGLVDKVLRGVVGPISNNGCPTEVGIIVHTLVFTLLLRYSMEIKI